MQSNATPPRLAVDNLAMDQPYVWHIPPSLPHSPPQVILLLGEPTQADLQPLLTSPHLARSLVLIVTHQPSELPECVAGSSGPDVRILRLPSLLAVYENGAIALVNLFERAQRVARLWRYALIYPPTSMLVQIQNHAMQLAEEHPGGEFTIVEPITSSRSRDGYGSNGTQERHLQPRRASPAPSFTSRASSIGHNHSPTSQSRTRKDSISTITKLYKQAMADMLHGDLPIPLSSSTHSFSTEIESLSGTRTFDAMLNFLPSGLPEKSLFQHAILLSTLCAQYLAPPVKPTPPAPSTTSAPSRSPSRKRSVIKKSSKAGLRPSTAPGPALKRSGTYPKAPSHDFPAPHSSIASPVPSEIHYRLRNAKRLSIGSEISAVSVALETIRTPRSTGDRRSSFGSIKHRWNALFGTSSNNSPPEQGKGGASNYRGSLDLGISTNRNRNQPMVRRGSSRNININTRSRTQNAHLVHILPNSAITEVKTNQTKNLNGHATGSVARDGVNTGQRAGTRTKNYSKPTAYMASTPLPETGLEFNASSSIHAQAFLSVPVYHTRTTSTSSGMSGISFSGTSAISATSIPPISPTGKPKIVAYLEQFLSNLAGEPNPVGSTTLDDYQKPIPYIVAESLFGQRIHGTRGAFLSLSSSTAADTQPSRELTVGEVILLGALDLTMDNEPVVSRCWVGSMKELVVAGSGFRKSTRAHPKVESVEPGHADAARVASPERRTRTPPPPTLVKIWEEPDQRSREEMVERVRAARMEANARLTGAEKKRDADLYIRESGGNSKRDIEESKKVEPDYIVPPFADKSASRTLPTPPESSSDGEVDTDRGRNSKKGVLRKSNSGSRSRAKRPSNNIEQHPTSSLQTIRPLPPLPTTFLGSPTPSLRSPDEPLDDEVRSYYAEQYPTTALRLSSSREDRPAKVVTPRPYNDDLESRAASSSQTDANTLWTKPAPQRIKPFDQPKVHASDLASRLHPLYSVSEDYEHSSPYLSVATNASTSRTPSPSSFTNTLAPLRRPGTRSIDPSATTSAASSLRASSPLVHSSPIATSPTITATVTSTLVPVKGRYVNDTDKSYESDFVASANATHVSPTSPTPSTMYSPLARHTYHPHPTFGTPNNGVLGAMDTDGTSRALAPQRPIHARGFDEDPASQYYPLRNEMGEDDRRKAGFTGTLKKLGLWKKDKTPPGASGTQLVK